MIKFRKELQRPLNLGIQFLTKKYFHHRMFLITLKKWNREKRNTTKQKNAMEEIETRSKRSFSWNRKIEQERFCFNVIGEKLECCL